MYIRSGEGAASGFAPVPGGFPGRYLGEAAVAMPQAACGAYESGEVQKSRTQAGHVEPDVLAHARGLLIRDFGVDWRHVRDRLKSDPALRQWLTEIVAVARANPTTKIQISGYSDCVGSENNNTFLRRGRAARVRELLHEMAGPGWAVLDPRTVAVPAPSGEYIAGNTTVDGRANNRSVLIENVRSVTDDPFVIQAPDNLGRIIKRGLELTNTLDQFGIKINAYQQRQFRCILQQLTRPGYDDRYLTGQGVLDYMNNVNMTEPYYAKATQWLLPDFAIKSGKTTPDAVIWRTLDRIHYDLSQGRDTITRYYHTHGAATPIRIQRMRDWVAKQQDDPRSIYYCYR